VAKSRAFREEAVNKLPREPGRAAFPWIERQLGSDGLHGACAKEPDLASQEARELREENIRLRRLVSDLVMDKHILAEVLRNALRSARRSSRVRRIGRSR